MEVTESIYVFTGKEFFLKKEGIENRRKFYSYILHFKSRFIYKYVQTILKIEFQ